MPVRKLTEKEELLESDRICSIAFAGSWSREEAIKALEAPSSPPPVSFGYFNQEGALTASMVLPEYQARYQGEAVPIIGVGGVASLPEHRYEGAVRQIFQTVRLNIYFSRFIYVNCNFPQQCKSFFYGMRILFSSIQNHLRKPDRRKYQIFRHH